MGSVQSSTFKSLVGNNYLIMIHHCPIHEQISDFNFTAPYPENLMFFYIIFNTNNLR